MQFIHIAHSNTNLHHICAHQLCKKFAKETMFEEMINNKVLLSYTHRQKLVGWTHQFSISTAIYRYKLIVRNHNLQYEKVRKTHSSFQVLDLLKIVRSLLDIEILVLGKKYCDKSDKTCQYICKGN